MSPELLAELHKHGMKSFDETMKEICDMQQTTKQTVESLQTNAVLATLKMCEEIAENTHIYYVDTVTDEGISKNLISASDVKYDISRHIKSKRNQIEGTKK